MGEKNKNQQPSFRTNVVNAFWRVVWGLKGDFEPRTINCTVEAECWIKAYHRALEDKDRIVALLGVSDGDVFVQSVTRIPTEDTQCH